MGAISLSGRLGYFDEITGGEFLPVALEPMPFIVAGATGLLCLAMYVAPGVVGARTGLIVHKLRSSRPPSTPFFQRYFIDVGLMVVGGLIFWNYSRAGRSYPAGCSESAA